ncbi:MAG: flippase-like domain-containing protein [Dehalococcoidia bacterium]|nr:flippase-like domain-containing protein [Dehalococcoidia bacterium]
MGDGEDSAGQRPAATPGAAGAPGPAGTSPDLGRPDTGRPDTGRPGRQWRRVAFQGSLGLAALAAFLWRVDIGAVVAQLGRIDIRWALVALVVFTGSKFIHGWRWWEFLGRREVPLKPLVGVFLVSNLANSVLPLRAGDLLRVEVPHHRWGVPRTTLASSVFVVESVLDLFAFAVLLVVALLLADLPAYMRPLVGLVGIASVLLFGAMVVAARARVSLSRWISRALSPLPDAVERRVGELIPTFIDGMASLSTNRQAVRVVVVSLVAWGVEVLVYWLMAQAFGLRLDLYQALILMIAANLIVSLPLTPWSVGPYELAVTEALVTLGADRVEAGAFAIGSHLMLQVWIMSTGIAAMLALRLSPRDLLPGRHEAAPAAPRRQEDGTPAP